ncbi:hypothetical protein [Sphingobacterium thalpophilum]|uniref:hypothetical protein n=1 Tax=Sphingobacterium thalpophilum TaxID=259 RepID=UPI003C7084C4
MKNITMKLGFASFLSLALLISSCSKDNSQPIVDAGTTVRLNIGQSYAKADPAKLGSTGRKYVAKAQTVEIPFDNQYTLVATLTEENAAPASGLRAANRAATVSSANEQVALKEGTTYYVAIFDAAGFYKETKSFTQGSGAQDFAIEKGKYTFVIYASGTNKALPGIQDGATLASVNFADLVADQDFMLDQVEYEVKEGQNVLNADLEHLFTQVSLKFDASAIGTVSSIAGASIEPSSAAVDVALANSTLSFKGGVNPVAFNLKNTSGLVINSDSTFITTAATADGIVKLKGVSIGGSAAKDVSRGGWNLKPGVKYILEFNLKAPVSVNVGDEDWALNNLEYDPSNGTYTFGQGDYWFPDRLLPKQINGTNGSANTSNGGHGDPCKLVAPAGDWRLPMESEIQKLWNRTNSGSADNPGPNPWSPPARYVDHFDGTSSTKLGMFFGVLTDPVTLPVSERGKYLFFPFGGYYPNDDIGATIDHEAAYLVTADAGGYRTLHLTGRAGDIGYGIGWRNATDAEAVQIRCVKNSPAGRK